MLSKYEIHKYNLLWKQKYKCWASMKYISIIYYESKNINIEQVWNT